MTEQKPRLLPLAGINVLDFSTLLPGPMASLMLAEAGAQIIKVERPGVGEDLRHYEPRWGRDAVSFALLNRGKKSLALDLKDKRQLSLLEPLLRQTDVVLEQFRPGVMDRLGLGYAALRGINPRLIYCSISGYGQAGPKSQVVGHDLNYIGDTGLLALNPGRPRRPSVPPVLAADLAGGSYPAVVNILLALLQRQKTGEGCHIDVSMTDNMFMLMSWALGQSLVTGKWPNPGRELLTGGSPRYHLYPAADGRYVAVAALEQKFWGTFCAIIELPAELRDDKADARATIDKVSEIIAARPAAHWKAAFFGKDCCCSVVATLEEAMHEPHFHIRGLFDHTIVNEDGEDLPAIPVAIAPALRVDAQTARSAPALGAHNDELLKR
jgi:crotonobetainyl-CoA:carnitine CoA-transferase CaiB-like acyl-CoA transferase